MTTEKTAERVERLLSGLSRSYPFLDLSRKTGARYDAVLLCADALDMSESEWNAHHVDAIIELSLDQLTTVSDVVRRGGVIW